MPPPLKKITFIQQIENIDLLCYFVQTASAKQLTQATIPNLLGHSEKWDNLFT